MAVKPVIGITMGDFNGIGPEIIIKSLLDKRLIRLFTPLIIGSQSVFEDVTEKLKAKNLIRIKYIDSLDNFSADKINIYDICNLEKQDISKGFSSVKSVSSAFTSLKTSIELWKKGMISALVTAPINKSSLKECETFYQGQTEFIAAESESRAYLMLMVSKSMNVGLVTTHHAVSDIVPLISEELIIEKAEILYKSLIRDFKIKNPVIGICALNPHAGDNRLFGNEEETIIKPAIKKLTKNGILAEGPFAADSLFHRYREKRLSAFLAMYHDQGLIPFKLISFNRGVNYTAGIPLIRTSPDHGVGYDIAEKMIADETSMKEAIKLAVKFAKRRSN